MCGDQGQMKFSTREDTHLPADALFAAISDFAHTERLLARRGAAVTRIDPSREPGAGMAWNILFDYNGRPRDLRLDVTRFDRPEGISLEGRTEPFDLLLNMNVIALTRAKSRLMFELDVKPRNMRARLMLQTAKLGKAQLDRRFAKRIAAYVDDTAQRVG